jgi:hypothetical protein
MLTLQVNLKGKPPPERSKSRHWRVASVLLGIVSMRCQNGLKGRAAGALLAAIAVAASAVPSGLASAQGFFDSWFGRGSAPSAPAYSNPSADFNPFGARPEPPRPQMGGSVVYCVRTCDGRYFPMQRVAGASPAQFCSVMCPASATKIYNGSNIDHAVGSDGKRYSELSTAFVYREKIVPGCTCNGKDAFGLVPLRAEDDPTLRAGDIVATRNGLMAYSGTGRGRNAQFTPIDAQRDLSEDMRRKLAGMKVDPVEIPAAPIPPSPADETSQAPAVRSDTIRRVEAKPMVYGPDPGRPY